jgi:phage antirepressor YoqD-like protein
MRIMKNEVFNYNGNNITFQIGNGDVMVNATEMAKNFGKRPIDFLQNQQTQLFISEYSKVRNSTLADLVKVTKGGVDSGTWMHEDIALEFARWLSPTFSIWCNDRIKELLKHGFTATDQKLEELANNPDLLISLASNLKKEREEKEQLRIKNELQEHELKKSAPKVAYCDTVLSSDSQININQIAKELGMSAMALNKKLKEMRIQYFQGEQWLLYAKYQNKGYASTDTHAYTNENGVIKTRLRTVWSEKGRMFIHSLLKESA